LITKDSSRGSKLPPPIGNNSTSNNMKTKNSKLTTFGIAWWDKCGRGLSITSDEIPA